MATPTDPRQGPAIAGPSPAPSDVLGAAPGPSDAERRELKKLKEAYEQARKFDKAARKQYALDRRYASGKADLSWAVSTNLIGAFVDQLVDSLYAQNPDVSVHASARVEHTIAAADGSEAGPPVGPLATMAAQNGTPPPPPDPGETSERETEDFARTLELVIGRLWKAGHLKKAARKQVRSALSVGPGWLKVIFQIDKRTDPEMQTQLNDTQDQLARLQAKRKSMAAGEVQDTQVAELELAELIEGLKAKVEVVVRKGLAIDFCPAEDVQVSLDVRDLEDYLDAEWIANAIYKPKSDLEALFPNLTPEQCKAATAYYQRKPKDDEHDLSMPLHEVTDKDADQFSATISADSGVAFARVVEFWDHRDDLIKTWVDGVDVFARQPYPPPQASTRFYPYFYLAFCETDGERHPQSISWRLRKLQDEYSSVRSNFRLSRSRSIPGVMFNAEQVDQENVKRLERGVQQEFIPIKPSNPATPLESLFAPKPTAKIDPLLFDVRPILLDMEKIAGVQESQVASAVQVKTATEAQIQQQGSMTRAGAARDALEDMLTDLAEYTAELALQGLEIPDAQRIAGPGAFWPHGMSIEDLLTMVEVSIAAGSTGKPDTAAERQSWTIAMPMISKAMVQIQEALTMGNTPLAQAMSELLRETLYRMGDNIDVDRFIPKPAPGQLPPPPPTPKVQVRLNSDLPPQVGEQFLTPGAHPPVQPAPNAPGPPGGPLPPTAAAAPHAPAAPPAVPPPH
jgi:hypothetical protein